MNKTLGNVLIAGSIIAAGGAAVRIVTGIYYAVKIRNNMKRLEAQAAEMASDIERDMIAFMEGELKAEN